MTSEFNPQIDYYEVLQVHPKADKAVIRGAFRAIVRELQAHPDLGGSHERAVLINDAYRVLSDAHLREAYDRARQDLLSPTASSSKSGGSSSRRRNKITCPVCGRRNQLRPDVGKNEIVCGACRARLFPSGRAHQRKAKTSVDSNRLGLPESLYRELRIRGEVEVRTDRLPRGGKITCRRCRRIWTALDSGRVPRTCSFCNAADWNAFRVFKCLHCGHEFTTLSLRRRPYSLFPGCPLCARPYWHTGLESGPVSTLLRFLKK
ncbi:MAG: DnaJ domain-containing protein [Armatimonadetes bacterium]|nr:DnaJ domain-containing protein [Armatimonadota bacterium]NIM23560.1 DnaJ domain-containing protein [Armatimonadota bacterium]NIM67426.1 DnaJ domain-containing protein [Armatimonadota bacterium]NIM75927.1 DnaJ domain-containing protein [Armatimonadota bacterium]NIN05612.1 DnaJ domain-containing protein [Armatimonadota bacterium]